MPASKSHSPAPEERPCHDDRVARTGVAAAFDAVVGGTADDRDVDRDVVPRRGRVAAGEHHPLLGREIAVSPQERFGPFVRHVGRQRHRQQRGDAPSAHGGHIAQIDRERLAAQFVRGRGVAQEMNALGEQIGGEEQRLAAADAEYRAVVSRLLEVVAGHSGEELPDAGDQFEFGHGTKIVQAERRTKFIWFCRGAAYLSGGLSSAKCASRVQKQPAIGNLRIKIRNSVPSSRGCARIGCCRSCGPKSAEHAHSGGPPRAEASARAALSAAMLRQGIITARQDAVLILIAELTLASALDFAYFG